MTGAPSFSVEIGDITDIDPFDCLAEIRMRGFNQKVIVIGHQAIRMNLYVKALYRFADIL